MGEFGGGRRDKPAVPLDRKSAEADPEMKPATAPNMGRRVPVAVQRKAAARQIQRSLAAWQGSPVMRDEKDENNPTISGDDEAKGGPALENSPQQQAPGVGTKVFLARGKGGDTLKEKKELQATVDKCGRCIKILEQFDRLAQKEKIEIPAAKLATLSTKRGDGSISGNDVPAGLRRVYDLDTAMTLTAIRAKLAETEAALKALK